jgi:PTH1 family peptidyl-tRNA hydrolase
MLVIAGLGNPGPRYAHNRHNVGFKVLADLAKAVEAPPWRDKFQGEIARSSLSDTDVLLVRPQTWMNESGRCVQAVMTFFRVPPKDLIVVHDELDLPFGTLRIKVGGGHAGHNGLRSIVDCLGSAEFVRLRVGIGRPPPDFRGEVADYVLSDFSSAERDALPEILSKAVKALRDIARRGVAAASNTLNARPKPPKPSKPRPDPAAGSDPPSPGGDPGDSRTEG